MEQLKSHLHSAYKRKVLLINPRFQLTFLGLMTGLSFVVIAAIYGANRYFFWKFEALGGELGLTPDHVFFQFIRQQEGTMNGVFLVISLAVFALINTVGLVLSHRIAGPLHRMTQHFRTTTGRARPVQFRKGDFFLELADAYNRHVSKSKHSAIGGEDPGAKARRGDENSDASWPKKRAS